MYQAEPPPPHTLTHTLKVVNSVALTSALLPEHRNTYAFTVAAVVKLGFFHGSLNVLRELLELGLHCPEQRHGVQGSKGLFGVVVMFIAFLPRAVACNHRGTRTETFIPPSLLILLQTLNCAITTNEHTKSTSAPLESFVTFGLINK